MRGVREEEEQHAVEDGESASEEVEVLPPVEGAGRDAREAVVQPGADDGPPARRGVPETLTQRLLALRVVAADDDHEGRGHDTLQEAEEEALGIETAPAGDRCSGHGNGTPDDYDGPDRAAEVKALEEVGQRENATEHAEVEDGGGPGKPLGANCGWCGRGVDNDGEGEIGDHAKDGSAPEDCL